MSEKPGARLTGTAAVLLAVVAQSVLAPAPARAAPPDRPVTELLGELRSRYQEAGAATQAYNAAQERLKRQRGKVSSLNKQLSKARGDLSTGQIDAGRLARMQYRESTAGLTPYLRMILSRDPQDAMDQRHLIRRMSGSQALTLSKLAGGEQKLTKATQQAQKALTRQRELAAERGKRRDAVQQRLDSVAKLLESFDDEQRGEVARLEETEEREDQKKFDARGLLNARSSAHPTAAGQRAIRYAVRQIGKPYRWGAAGPAAFDCSGLTSRAWEAGQVRVGRTSQQQWRQLPRVKLGQLRPGDLVVYFEDATHVGLYLGEGKVVHAPRPGSRVKVSPIAANPVLGAVRPDAEARPLADYVPPRLPEGATEGDDTGYSAGTAPNSP